MCFWPSVSCACVDCAVCTVSPALNSWVYFCCDCLSCTCSGIAGCWVTVFCALFAAPVCCAPLGFHLRHSVTLASCHTLSLLFFLAWVYFFGIYSGLGLRCCGPGYGSSLLFFGGGLSFPCSCCFSLAITTFSFCPGNLGFLDFLLGFLSLDFSVLPVVQSGLGLMFQFCPISSVAVHLSGLFFVSSFF